MTYNVFGVTLNLTYLFTYLLNLIIAESSNQHGVMSG